MKINACDINNKYIKTHCALYAGNIKTIRDVICRSSVLSHFWSIVGTVSSFFLCWQNVE